MKTSLSALHHQATDWLRELDFYNDEIGLLLTRLKTAHSENKKPELSSQFEEFEKQLKDLEREISERKHDVTVREEVVENMTKENLGEDEDEEISPKEDVILQDMKDLVHEIADTRFLLNLFLVKAI